MVIGLLKYACISYNTALFSIFVAFLGVILNSLQVNYTSKSCEVKRMIASLLAFTENPLQV